MKKLAIFLCLISLGFSQQDSVYLYARNDKKSKFLTTVFEKVILLYSQKKSEKLSYEAFSSETSELLNQLLVKKNEHKAVCSFGIIIADNDYAVKRFSYSTPILPTKNAILSKKKINSKEIENLAIFYRKNGSKYYLAIIEKLKKQGFEISNIVYFDEYKMLIPALKSGKIDFVIADSIDGWLDEEIEIVYEIDEMPEFLAYVYPKNSQLKEKFDPVLKYFIKSPLFYKILEKYFGAEFREYYIQTMRK
jgi:hypothetical protein